LDKRGRSPVRCSEGVEDVQVLGGRWARDSCFIYEQDLFRCQTHGKKEAGGYFTQIPTSKKCGNPGA